MRTLAAVLVTVSALAGAACFDIEQTLTIEKDMSGTAGLSMKVDLEPIAGFMATLKRSMTGQTGAATEADIAEARKELLSSTKQSVPIDIEKEKKEWASALPAGVRLLDASMKDDGLKLAANIRLAVDQMSKLTEIKLAQKPGAASALPMDNPMESPFEGLQIVDEGRTLLITSPARNPMGEKQKELGQLPGMDAGMKGQIDTMLRGLRIAFRITAPFAVVEHNAHRKEGNTLVWDYNIAALEKMSNEQMMQGIRVRYRK